VGVDAVILLIFMSARIADGDDFRNLNSRPCRWISVGTALSAPLPTLRIRFDGIDRVKRAAARRHLQRLHGAADVVAGVARVALVRLAKT
jgi:hypothetical protein